MRFFLLFQAFGIVLTPAELGALVQYLSPGGVGESIFSKDFLIKFNQMGFRERSRIKKDALEKQRRENLEQKREQEEKLANQVEKAEFKMDWTFTSVDFDQAMEMIATAAKKFDKTSSSAPNVEGDLLSIHKNILYFDCKY